jgi:Transposase IS4
MVLFKGRSSLNQYMAMKPTKRGYKIWARANAITGHVFQLEVYNGKGQDVVEVGLDGRVVKDLSDSLKNMRIHLIFDNFFNTAGATTQRWYLRHSNSPFKQRGYAGACSLKNGNE